MEKTALRVLFSELKRSWFRPFQSAFALLGGCWLLVEIATKSSTEAELFLKHYNIILYFLLFTFLLTLFFTKCTTRQIIVSPPGANVRIKIFFGDLLDQQQDIVIAVGEFFDGEIGLPVDKRSLHGLFIEKFFDSKFTSFRHAVLGALKGLPNSGAVNRTQLTGVEHELPNIKYQAGTTIKLPIGAHKAYPVVTSSTDVRTSKSESSIPKLWGALQTCLYYILQQGGSEPAAFPLMGDGLSNINLPPQQILRILVMAMVSFTKLYGGPRVISIVLHDSKRAAIDLRELETEWAW